ncbi:hypothetical protein BGAL_0740g00010 [Botrytis galanthina]|uniref:Ubiquitin-like protease family profile domain-containing protein n=1 Tax=Botrytis galanthina TaxID=278940 RepID=A0A4S8QKZ2_9HELO|nr:hypothetical protein BGAL_0740g00010 [Botrytis galanthina]
MKEVVEDTVEKALEQFTSIFESTSEITAEANQDLIDGWEDLYQSYINKDWEARDEDEDNHESSNTEVDINNELLFEDWIVTRLESDIVFKTMEILHHDDWHKLHKDKKTLTENLRQVFSLNSIWELFFWLGRRTIQSRDSLRTIKSIQSETGYTFPIILEALRTARLVRKGNRKKGSRNDMTWFPREDTECAKRELLEEKRRNGGSRKKRRKAEIMGDGYLSSASSTESTPMRTTLKKTWIGNGEAGSQEVGVGSEGSGRTGGDGDDGDDEQVQGVSKPSILKSMGPSASSIITKSTTESTTKPNSAVKLRNQANPSSPLTPELARRAPHNLSFHMHSSSPSHPNATLLATIATPTNMNMMTASARSQVVKRRRHPNVGKDMTYKTFDHNEKGNVSFVRQDVSPVAVYNSDSEGWVGGGAGSDIMNEDGSVWHDQNPSASQSCRLVDPFIRKSPCWRMARSSNEDLRIASNKERGREGTVVDELDEDNERKLSLAQSQAHTSDSPPLNMMISNHNPAPTVPVTIKERIEPEVLALQKRNSTLSSSSSRRPPFLPWKTNEKIIVNHIEIGERHVSKLRGKLWLDDDTINASMSILKDKSKESSRISLQSSLLLSALESGNHCSKWDKTNEVFTRDYTIIPINFDNLHWYLAVIVDLKNVSRIGSTSTPATTTSDYLHQGYPIILTIDTLLGQTNHSKAVTLLQNWIIKRAEAEFNLEIPRSSIKWQHRLVTCQQNGYDCGVFVVKMFEQFLKCPENFLSTLLLDSVSGRREMLEEFERMLSASQEQRRNEEKGGTGEIRREKECGNEDNGGYGGYDAGDNNGVLDGKRIHGQDDVIVGDHGEDAITNEHHVDSDTVMLTTIPPTPKFSSKLSLEKVEKHQISKHTPDPTNEHSSALIISSQSNPLSTSIQQKDQYSRQSNHISSWIKIRVSKFGILQKCYGPEIISLAQSIDQRPQEEEGFVIILKEQWDYLITSSGLPPLEFTPVSPQSLDTHCSSNQAAILMEIYLSLAIHESASHNSHKRNFEAFSIKDSERKEERPSFKPCNPVQEELSSVKTIKTIVVSILNYLDNLTEIAMKVVTNGKGRHIRMQKMRQDIIEKVLGRDGDDTLDGGDESELKELCLNGLDGEINKGKEKVKAIERMLECIRGENVGVECMKDEFEGGTSSEGTRQVYQSGCKYEYEKWCVVLWGVKKMIRELKELVEREKLK